MGMFSPVAPGIGRPYTPFSQSVPTSPAPVVSQGAAPTTGGTPIEILRRILIANGHNPDEVAIYINDLEAKQAAYTASAGHANKVLESQINDAKLNREQAWRLAKFQATTQTGLQNRQLQQQAEQFKASHGLEMARAAASFESSPDMQWSRDDFKSALGRVSQGYSPAPISESASPKPKSWEDFQALTNVGGASKSSGNATADPGGRTGSTTDPRMTAASAVMKAIPPSESPGNDGQDWMALRAIENLYMAGRPGEVERLGAPRRKIAQAGLARLGYDPALVEQDRMRALPGQSSVRAA